jgi:hypothetical protein
LRAKVVEDLLNLQVALRLDGLAVKAVARLQPRPQQPRLADAPTTENNQQPATLRRRVEFAQLRRPVDEIHAHVRQHASGFDACQT